MTDALSFFFKSYNNLLRFLFSGINLLPGIPIGWILLSIFVILLLIKIVLNVPDVGKGNKK